MTSGGWNECIHMHSVREIWKDTYKTIDLLPIDLRPINFGAWSWRRQKEIGTIELER